MCKLITGFKKRLCLSRFFNCGTKLRFKIRLRFQFLDVANKCINFQITTLCFCFCVSRQDDQEVMGNSLCPQMEFRPSGPFSPLTPYY
jgi:hypothetical protein